MASPRSTDRQGKTMTYLHDLLACAKEWLFCGMGWHEPEMRDIRVLWRDEPVRVEVCKHCDRWMT